MNAILFPSSRHVTVDLDHGDANRLRTFPACEEDAVCELCIFWMLTDGLQHRMKLRLTPMAR